MADEDVVGHVGEANGRGGEGVGRMGVSAGGWAEGTLWVEGTGGGSGGGVWGLGEGSGVVGWVRALMTKGRRSLANSLWPSAVRWIWSGCFHFTDMRDKILPHTFRRDYAEHSNTGIRKIRVRS